MDEEAPGEARARSSQYDYAANSNLVVRHEPTGEALTGNAVYEPRTRETRAAYEALLTVIQQQQLGGRQLPDSLADEVLAALKNDKLTNAADRKKQIEELIRYPISNLVFEQLFSLGKLITDFHDAVACPSARRAFTHMTLQDAS